jgi:putative membrane protein
MRIISYLILLIIMLIGLTFSALNPTEVVFNYYLGSKSVALSILLVVVFGMGIFLGLLISLFSWLRIKGDNMWLKSRLKNVEKEVQNLRSIPIRDE